MYIYILDVYTLYIYIGNKYQNIHPYTLEKKICALKCKRKNRYRKSIEWTGENTMDSKSKGYDISSKGSHAKIFHVFSHLLCQKEVIQNDFMYILQGVSTRVYFFITILNTMKMYIFQFGLKESI